MAVAQCGWVESLGILYNVRNGLLAEEGGYVPLSGDSFYRSALVNYLTSRS